MYPNLKLQIFRLGIHQNRLAEALRMDETVLSKIIHGHREPSAEQRRSLASYLRAAEEWLFEKYNGMSPDVEGTLVVPAQDQKDGNHQ